MASVDDRVVQMEFDNRSFQSAVTATLSMLDKLKSSLTFTSNKNGIDDLQASASKFSLSPVTNALDGVSSKFSAMSVIGITALASIASKAVDAGISLVKSLTVDPLKAGLDSYNDTINATQVILANTKAAGVTLKDVTSTLADLQNYANLTVYSFSDMTSNIAKFTAAGVPLKQATSAIKGMANVAALSGANTEQMSSAMYQMSQALSTGTIRLQDWNSLSNANMAGTNVQQALEETAKTMANAGKPMDAAIKKYGNFRNSLQSGWLTADIYTKAMTVMAGTVNKSTGKMEAFSVAQLKAMGYTDAAAKSLNQLSQSALNSAIQIRTLPQMMQALKEEVATAYGQVFKTIFGNIDQATMLFTAMHNTIENALTGPIYAFNGLLIAASALGARTNVIKGFTNIIKALGTVIKPIEAAFREIFPPETAKELNDLTKSFQSFTAKLILSKTSMAEVKSTFAGIFAILDLGRQVVVGVLSVIGTLFSTFDGGGSKVLKFTGNLGDTVVAFDKMVTKGKIISDFFDKLGQELLIPIHTLGVFRDTLVTLFNNIKLKDANAVSDAFQTMGAKLGPVNAELDKLGKAFVNFFKPLGQELKPALDAVVNLFSQLGNNIATALQNQDFTGINKILQTGLLAGIFLTIKKFFSSGLTISPTGGIVNSIRESFEGLTGTLKAMQLQLKAKTLEEIAVAIGLLTVSVVALSFINAANLQKSLQAMSGGFAELLTSLIVLSKISGGVGTLKLPVMAAALVILSGAILTLTASVAILGTMKWDTLKQGLEGVGILLGTVTAAALIISKNSGGMVAAGIGITAIATAMVILAGAVKLFGSMDLPTLGKGIGAVAASLLVIAGAMHLMPKGLLVDAVGITALAVALQGIFLAVKSFASLDYKTMGRGMAGVAASLLVIAGAMHLMPKGMAVQAASLLVISAALVILQKAVASFATMSWAEIGKGIAALAVALGTLVLAVNLMDGAVLGAAALALVTVSLQALVPVIQQLSSMSWADIGKGIGAFAAALAVLILAGYAAEGAALGLLALGVAALALGAGLALAGIGIQGIGTGLGLLAKEGSAGITVLLAAVSAFVSQIPAIATSFAQGLINVLKIIGNNGPAIIAAFSTIIGSLLTAITDNVPKMAVAIEAVIAALLAVINKDAPLIIAAGLSLLENLLKGIQDNIGQVVTEVATIIINLLNALAAHIPAIIAAGVNVLVSLLSGITRNLPRAIAAASGVVTAFIGGIGNLAGSIITAGANVIIQVISGLGRNLSRVVAAGTTAIISFVNGLGAQGARIANAAGDAILTFLVNLDAAIRTYEPQIISECGTIGVDIVKGIVQGLGDVAGTIFGSLKSGISGAIGSGIGFAKGLLGSPYKIGALLSEGMVQGVEQNSDNLNDAVSTSITDAIKAAGRALSTNSIPNLSLRPTITPVLDLTDVASTATKINGLLSVAPINASSSFAQASSISEQQRAVKEAAFAATPTPGETTQITFQQTNTSPKALDATTIYRNTKNQIALAKEALSI